MEKLTLWCLVILGASAVSSVSGEPFSLECLKRYLSDRNANEDLLSYVNPFVGSLTDCESAVKTKLASIHSNLRSRLDGNRLHRPYVSCTMRDIEEDDESYELYVLRETAIEMISGWRFWSYWSKNKRLDELKALSNGIVQKSLLKCKGHREFTDFFNNIQENELWTRTGEDEYCIRNYLVNKALLNKNYYNFRPNPRNVRTENLNCEQIVNAVKKGLLEEVKTRKSLSDCYKNIYEKNNYADYVMKAEVLSKLLLEPSDKSRERQDFIVALVDITYEADKC